MQLNKQPPWSQVTDYSSHITYIINSKHIVTVFTFCIKKNLPCFQVSDQQVTLEKAGVPGFFVTNKPIEIKVQMYLLDFILRLSNMNLPC